VGSFQATPGARCGFLLTVILNDRPENLLPLRDDERLPPIVDYHLLRSCLRIGLIDVMEDDLYDKLVDRQIVSPAEEWAVRLPVYRAIEQVYELSGRRVGAVDEYFFSNARKRCPEMSEPQCDICQVDSVCAQRIELFQSVLRTIYY
jgi:hypothetical protein